MCFSWQTAVSYFIMKKTVTKNGGFMHFDDHVDADNELQWYEQTKKDNKTHKNIQSKIDVTGRIKGKTNEKNKADSFYCVIMIFVSQISVNHHNVPSYLILICNCKLWLWSNNNNTSERTIFAWPTVAFIWNVSWYCETFLTASYRYVLQNCKGNTKTLAK